MVQTTLIAFLGTSQYEPVAYRLPPMAERADGGVSKETRFTQVALAEACSPTSVVIVCTEKAKNTHGAALSEELGRDPQWRTVPEGRRADDLWTLFSTVVKELESPDSSFILDVTHGWRAQPVFVSAALTFTRALGTSSALRVYYGAYNRESPGDSAIWDLTPTVEVMDWSIALGGFLTSGRARSVASHTHSLDRELRRTRAAAGTLSREQPLHRFATALEELSHDLDAIRVGGLLYGNDGNGGSAWRALDTLLAAQKEVEEDVPVLAQAFDRVKSTLEPLTTNIEDGVATHLGTPGGLRAMLALARQYHRWGRHVEALAVVREGSICIDAPAHTCIPGASGFRHKARKAWDTAWGMGRAPTEAELQAAEAGVRGDGGGGDSSPDKRGGLAGLRNDVLHAGFTDKPVSAKKLGASVGSLVDDFARRIES